MSDQQQCLYYNCDDIWPSYEKELDTQTQLILTFSIWNKINEIQNVSRKKKNGLTLYYIAYACIK